MHYHYIALRKERNGGVGLKHVQTCKHINISIQEISKQELMIILPSYIYNSILHGINSFLIYYTYVIINIYIYK